MRYLRVAWAAVAALSAAVFVWSLPGEFGRLRTVCEGGVACAWLPRLTAEGAARLGESGLSPDFFAAYFVALEVAFTAASFVMGAFILWRRPDDGMALLASLMLLTWGAAFFVPYPLLDLPPLWSVCAQTVSFIGSVLLVLFLYLFPDGRFAPRWTRWPAAVWVAGFVPVNFFYGFTSRVFDYPLLSTLLVACFVGVTAYAQVHRYRHVSTPEQRLQTRWVVFGIVGALGGVGGLVVLDLFVPGGVLAGLFGSTALFFFAFLVPLTIGVAVSRYRLFDVDVLINRTLVYGSLTVALALVYAGCVVLLQAVFVLLTGGGSSLTIVASTLAIAALFSPLRRRIQRFIDRRFYRRKYDARKVLEGFSARLRGETDLEDLTKDLLLVVRDTVRPERTSLWLRRPEDGR